MKNIKFYLVACILIFNFSFFLQGNNIVSNEENNNDNRKVLTTIATSNSLSSKWYRTWGELVMMGVQK